MTFRGSGQQKSLFLSESLNISVHSNGESVFSLYISAFLPTNPFHRGESCIGALLSHVSRVAVSEPTSESGIREAERTGTSGTQMGAAVCGDGLKVACTRKRRGRGVKTAF